MESVCYTAVINVINEGIIRLCTLVIACRAAQVCTDQALHNSNTVTSLHLVDSNGYNIKGKANFCVVNINLHNNKKSTLLLRGGDADDNDVFNGFSFMKEALVIVWTSG